MVGLTGIVGITLATTTTANALVATSPIVGITPTADGGGYWMVASDGGVFAFGDAPFEGSMGGIRLNQPVVGMAADTQTGGYWLVARDGGIFAFNAPFYGSMGGVSLAEPIVGMTSTPDGNGYWLVARDGGVFAFGDAQFYGSGANAPVVGMAVDPRTGGYRMATSTGGLWWDNSSSLGWVTGSLNAPVVGIATDVATGGYWMVASDGGVFAFNAAFLGSMGGTRLNKPVAGMAGTPDGNGYWLVAKDGGVFAFGDAGFYGSVPGIAPPAAPPAPIPTRPLRGIATTLGAGTFSGGTDVAPGLYNVTPGPGQSGNFFVQGTDSYNEILGGSFGVSEVRAAIARGDSIEISGLSQVTFTPVTTPFVTTHTLATLYAGTWIVGQDIGAGRYVATPGSGESGNFFVEAESVNEILGGPYGVPNVTANLKVGDVIAISGLSQVIMTPR